VEKLTDTQEKAFEYIRSAIEDFGRGPTLRELCEFMGYKAVGSAQDLVNALRKKGYLKKPDKQSARSLMLSEQVRQAHNDSDAYDDLTDAFTVPCLGFVPAGNPVEAIEDHIGTLCLTDSMLPKPRPRKDRLFALKATGLSMINAGICDGDWLIVHEQKDVEKGAIVVARVDGDATVKRLMQDGSGFYLKPENPDFSNIYANESNGFELIGKVVALHRNVIS
jgi:repressor LexA